MKSNVFAWLSGVVFWCITGTACAELAVISHPGLKLVGISVEELRQIYLGQTKFFPNGISVDCADQENGSVARRQFVKSVLGMDEGSLRSYWAKQIFTGKAKPPRTVNTDEEMRTWVSENPNGLGYIQGKYVNSSVKVLLILP